MSKSKQLGLPGMPTKPRRKPRKLMHVIDAGDHGCVYDEGNDSVALFRCKHCDYESDWLEVKLTTARRGIPCPQCNPTTQE